MTTQRTGAAGNKKAAPTGRDNVTAAILDSAAEMFAERGPAAASIRDIAAHANVNHGLIFRHFGSKEQLVAAVLDQQAAQLAELMDADAPLPDVAIAGTRQLRVLTRTLLDGYPVSALQTSFPAAERLLAEIRAQHKDEDSARMATAHAIALLLGWQLFEPFLRTAIGLPDLTKEQLRQSIFVGMATLAQPH